MQCSCWRSSDAALDAHCSRHSQVRLCCCSWRFSSHECLCREQQLMHSMRWVEQRQAVCCVLDDAACQEAQHLRQSHHRQSSISPQCLHLQVGATVSDSGTQPSGRCSSNMWPALAGCSCEYKEYVNCNLIRAAASSSCKQPRTLISSTLRSDKTRSSSSSGTTMRKRSCQKALANSLLAAPGQFAAAYKPAALRRGGNSG